MSEREFFEQSARTRVREAIESVEAKTSAELVVMVRRESGKYRVVDVCTGGAVAFFVLLLLLFLPWPFDVLWMPAEVLLGFGIGYLASSMSWTLKRGLVCKKTLDQTTWRHACTLFHEKGISQTTGRNGILVMVSMMERRIVVVTDLGIDVTGLGTPWQDAIAALRDSVRKRPNFGEFVSALESLGPALETQMPRMADDVNELPDEPDVV